MAELLYQGHGSFRICTAEGAVIYVDPYAGEGYDREADLVLVTHEHYDHNQVDLVHLKADGKIYRAADFLKDGTYGSMTACGVEIRSVEAYNQNHPKDQCVGFLMKVDGKLLYLAGDTSETEEMKALAKEPIDYAFLPMDGIYNMDRKEAERCARIIGAAHTVPVHMKPGALFDEETAQAFQAEGKVVMKPGDTLTW
ncbi:MAG TPA: MBL fold metallo-hydrolase [Candidatus Lachnoclostridium avicola]|nr:MBL fold metallo-hydrolase [Candidatus Lachnoclostridium avicola]